jgi:hypothetical protein
MSAENIEERQMVSLSVVLLLIGMVFKQLR